MVYVLIFVPQHWPGLWNFGSSAIADIVNFRLHMVYKRTKSVNVVWKWPWTRLVECAGWTIIIPCLPPDIDWTIKCLYTASIQDGRVCWLTIWSSEWLHEAIDRILQLAFLCMSFILSWWIHLITIIWWSPLSINGIALIFALLCLCFGGGWNSRHIPGSMVAVQLTSSKE